MTPEAQRIAIAEACGWKHEPGEEPTVGGRFKIAAWISPSGKRYVSDWRCKCEIGLPDYLSDLNAMHEAEQTLRNNQFHFVDYYGELYKSVSGQQMYDGEIGYFSFGLVTATAAQRAEAFLRTIGKWKD